MNPDYKKIPFEDMLKEHTLDEMARRQYYSETNGWENSRAMGKTFTVSVLSGPDIGAALDYYYYSEARRKMNELLTQGICAIMRLDNGN